MMQTLLFVPDLLPGSSACEREIQRYRPVEHAQRGLQGSCKPATRRVQSHSRKAQRPWRTWGSVACPPPVQMEPNGTTIVSEARIVSGRKAACELIHEESNVISGIDSPLDQSGLSEPDEHRPSSIRQLWKRSLSILVDSSNHVDPLYRCSRAGNASSFNRAVEYFWHNYHVNYSRWYPIFEVEAVNSRLTWALMEQEPFVHIWLGFMHLNKAIVRPEAMASSDSARHIGIGISQLRRIMAKGATTGFHATERDCLVGSIFLLALIARLHKDPRASELHGKNMISLIMSQGGSERLGCEGRLSAAILHDECLQQLDTAETAFPVHYPSHHPVLGEAFTTELREQVALLPYGFQHLVKIEAFPVDLVRLLLRIKQAQDVDGQGSEARDQFYSGARKYSGFWEACSPLRTPGPSFRKFLCLTLLLYVQIQFAPNQQILPLQSTYTSPRTLLTKQIHLLEKLVRSKASRECWMWMWMVLIDSWVGRKKTGRLTEEGASLLVDFRLQFPEVTTWDALDTVLDKFFCLPEFRAACKSNWEYA